MVYDDSPLRRPVRILRFALPSDIAEHGRDGQPAGRDPGVYRVMRGRGKQIVLCEYAGCPGDPLSGRRVYIRRNNGDATFQAPTIHVVSGALSE